MAGQKDVSSPILAGAHSAIIMGMAFLVAYYTKTLFLTIVLSIVGIIGGPLGMALGAWLGTMLENLYKLFL